MKRTIPEVFTVMTQQPPEAELRRALRVLTMVHELHKAGYQRVRIFPCSSSAGYWRCWITPASNILRSHGAMIASNADELMARYSSGQGNHYFEFKDAADCTARELAVKFIERFPRISELGTGQDWDYAGWYVTMLGFAERGDFPLSMADSWYGEPNPRWLPTTMKCFESGLPMPPPGEHPGTDRPWYEPTSQ